MSLINKIALGTVQFGLDYGISNQSGRTSEKEVQDILSFVAQKGISVLDTAQAYGDSETVLGRYHENRFDIVTKIQVTAGGESATELVKKSLDRLSLNSLYAVLFHNAESVLKNPDAYNELNTLKERGIICKTGCSVYTPKELELLIDAFGNPDLIQVPFSHLDRRFEAMCTDLHKAGVEIHSRSTFLQGLLFMTSDEITPFFAPLEDYLKVLNTYFPNTIDKSAFLLNHVVAKPFVDKVVLGVNNIVQIEENIEALKVDFHDVGIETVKVPDEILLPYLWQ